MPKQKDTKKAEQLLIETPLNELRKEICEVRRQQRRLRKELLHVNLRYMNLWGLWGKHLAIEVDAKANLGE